MDKELLSITIDSISEKIDDGWRALNEYKETFQLFDLHVHVFGSILTSSEIPRRIDASWQIDRWLTIRAD